jgi:hypothetical protein
MEQREGEGEGEALSARRYWFKADRISLLMSNDIDESFGALERGGARRSDPAIVAIVVCYQPPVRHPRFMATSLPDLHIFQILLLRTHKCLAINDNEAVHSQWRAAMLTTEAILMTTCQL